MWGLWEGPGPGRAREGQEGWRWENGITSPELRSREEKGEILDSDIPNCLAASQPLLNVGELIGVSKPVS